MEHAHILLVDDRPGNLLVLESILGDLDCRLCSVGSGYEALHQVMQHDFALVLLDVQMPDLDGFEVAKLMRSVKRSKHTPIIFVTAINKEQSHVFKGYESGAVDYLFKPIDPNVLRSKTKVFLDLYRQKHLLETQAEELTRAKQIAEDAQKSAEAANRAKSTFLANMSHELRTPLNAVLGYAQILQKDEGISEFQRSRLQVIRQNGEHLLHLLNDILDLAKIEAERMEICFREFSFSGFLKSLIHNFRLQAEQKHLCFAHDIAPGLPDAVKGDEIRLRQVLINLLGNAVKYTERGGVRLRVERVQEHQTSKEADTGQASAVTLRFLVEDTGPGIPPEEIESVFSPFSQGTLHAGTAKGTGLGLAISTQLVKLMGGELQVKSTVGQGSSFVAEIPLLPVESWTELPKSDSSLIVGYTGRKRNILVVDDHPVNRSVLVDLLLPLGFEIAEAGSGREALTILDSHVPDFIFMDLIMPEMDGFETTRQIRQTESSRQRPAIDNRQSTISRSIIVALSASAFEKDRQHSLEAGCDGFLAKPIQADEVLDCLRDRLTLEWVFQAPPDTSEYSKERVESMHVPSPETLNELLQLAQIGDIASLQEQAEALKRQEPDLTPFAVELLRLLKGFQVNEIRLFLQELGKNQPEDSS